MLIVYFREPWFFFRELRRRLALGKGGFWWWWWLTVVVVESSRNIFSRIAVSCIADNQAGFAHSAITDQDALDPTTVVVACAAAASAATIGWWHVAVGILQLLTQ